MSDDRKKAFWFIALLSMLVILPFLGETIFYSKGEPREAIVAFSMLESGNWILPVNYGTDIAYKPPFLYWAIAAISSLFGGVSEYSSRLPSAIAFLAMQLVFFSFIAKRKGVKTAFLTSILLLSSFEVHRAAVACRVDMLQVSLIVISLCLLFRWDEKECRGIPWLAVLLMGCATLTKGPVGSIFPCVCIGLYQLLRGRSFWKTFFLLLLVGILSLIPYAAWAGAAYAQGTSADIMAYDGNENTFALYDTQETASPMAEAVFDLWRYGQSAYVPSVAEMRLLYTMRKIINPVIEQCGGEPLPLDENDCWYWTSTEVEKQQTAKAWLYSMGSGAMQETPKVQAHKVRPIITINE